MSQFTKLPKAKKPHQITKVYETRSQTRKKTLQPAPVKQRPIPIAEKKIITNVCNDFYYLLNDYVSPLDLYNFVITKGYNTDIICETFKKNDNDVQKFGYDFNITTDNSRNGSWIKSVYKYSRLMLSKGILPIESSLIKLVITGPLSTFYTSCIGIIIQAIKDFKESSQVEGTMAGKIDLIYNIFKANYSLPGEEFIGLASKIIRLKSLDIIPTINDISDCIKLISNKPILRLNICMAVQLILKKNPTILQNITREYINDNVNSSTQTIINILIEKRADLIDDELFVKCLELKCDRICVLIIIMYPDINENSKNYRLIKTVEFNNSAVFNMMLEKKYIPSAHCIDHIFYAGKLKLALACLNNDILPSQNILNNMPISLTMNVITKRLIEKNYVISELTIKSAIVNNNVYALQVLLDKQTCDLNLKTPEALITAIKCQNLLVVEYLLESGWPLPDINTLHNIITGYFNYEIFNVLFSHIGKNRILSNTAKDSLTLQRLSDVVIKNGLTGVIKLFIEQPGFEYPKNEWINNLIKLGAIDLVNYINNH
jgi:hypothetical protein